ncbi:Cytochrome P450 [Phytophthora megakarya]|uniref:Cytochrome P450 n=1 Tax=Phytophthora megakarya TaxID=4795 RepID=A0A225VZV2_9STRA|nr:Cytochrome P450 [Phytophthora megakarya]
MFAVPPMLATIFALYLVWWKLFAKPSPHINGQKLFRPASTLPILGNTLDVLWFQRDRLHDWMTEQSLLNGGKPWLLTGLGQVPKIVVTSAAAYEDVFKTQFNVLIRGSGEAAYDVLGEGIFNVDGDKWKHQRRVTSHLFSMHMLKDCMNAVIREKTLKLRDLLAKCGEKGDPVSMKMLFNKFTADTFTRIGFGVEVNGLDDPVDVDTTQPVDAALQVVQTRLQSPVWLWKLRRFLNIGSERVMRESMQKVHDTIEQIMTKSLQEKQHSTDEKATHKDLMTLMVQSGEFTDVRTLRDVAVNFYAAGKDTTGFSLSWFVVMMNRYPHVLCKIREELRCVVPEMFTGELDTPTLGHLQQLTYLEAALKESLRLHSLVVYRLAAQDTTLYDGTFVPKGARVIFSMYASARQPTVWGPDAAEYKPERWIDESGKLKNISSFQFVSFSAGPRQCIGMRLAMMEMMTVLSVLFSRFDLVTVEDSFDLTYDFSLMLPVKGPFAIRVQSLAAHVA